MRYTVTQSARESVRLCSFRGSYVREFELLFSNLVNKIIGAVTNTVVKGFSHVNEASVKFNVGLVYRGDMWLHVN